MAALGATSTRTDGPGTPRNSTEVESTNGSVPGTSAISASGNLPTELATSHMVVSRMAPSPWPPSIFTASTALGTGLPDSSSARSVSRTESPAVMVRPAGWTSIRLTGDDGMPTGAVAVAVGCWKASRSAGSAASGSTESSWR